MGLAFLSTTDLKLFNKVLKSRLFIMKSESIKKLLAVFLLSLAAIASMSTSQAELIDLSNSESAIKFTATNASWEVMPRFR